MSTESVEITGAAPGVTYVRGTVHDVAQMLRAAGFPKDAERLEAAEARRAARRAKRRG